MLGFSEICMLARTRARGQFIRRDIQHCEDEYQSVLAVKASNGKAEDKK